jgi:hypothetical protein
MAAVRGSLLLVGALALVRCSAFDSGDPEVTPPPSNDGAAPPPDGSSSDGPVLPSDGGVPPRCDPKKPFENPMRLEELPNGCAAGRMTEDRLRLYFFAPDPTLGLRIFTATRASVADPFNSATLVDLATPINEIDSHPTITKDGNTLFFQRSADGGDRNILYAPSAGPAGFGAPNLIPTLSNPNVVERTPFTASDGALWVTLDITDGGFTRRIARAEKIGEGVYGTPLVVDLRTPGGEDSDPVLSADLLHIYFASTRGTNEFNMFMASRPSPTAEFEQPISLTSLNSTNAEQPTSISSDDCELLFNRSSGTAYHIWRATRSR